jgi:ribosomal protein S18 acetylase RimI-like enzyme
VTGAPTIEEASPEDRIAIAHLNVWAYREFSVDLGAEVWPGMVKTLTAIAPAAETATFLVVRGEDGLIGSVAYRPPGWAPPPLPAAWASIDLIAVAPNARNAGLGRALVNACLDRAEADGADTVGATVNGLMTGAQALFSHLGFHKEQGLARKGAQPYWLYRKGLGSGSPS